MNRPSIQWENIIVCCIAFACAVLNGHAAETETLKPAAFAHYVEHFNSMEDENVTNTISNAGAWDWMQKEIPLFECPDKEVEEMYYFRWWSYRKHLVQTTNGWVITEFLTPVRHAGIYDTVSCAAGFHIAEGRWLHNGFFLDDYAAFWLRGDGGKPQPHFHKYSSWFAAAVYDRYLVTGDIRSTTNLLADLVADYQAWEQEHQTNGLFWQFDVRDGMEESISGSRTAKNLRPTINAYMFANAQAIAAIARLAGDKTTARQFDGKAKQLKKLVLDKLWDAKADFFEVRHGDGTFSGAREELGYIPWMFNLADAGKKYDAAWRQLEDPKGFAAPAGLTTAERRHPQFRSHGVGTCEWDGAVWPFGTCQTLYGLANVLRDGKSDIVSTQDYFDNFMTYVHSQHADGKPYIGEYHDEVTGEWINGKGGRSRYYNHSTFADLLITGVIGLQPRADATVEIQPLLPPGTWDWFCVEGVPYHGHMLAIYWDKDGSRYGRGAGLTVLADGKEIAHSEKLAKLAGKLP
ncbi:MAG TPA: glycosyl hydrolase family 65 protein [Verrucomicrobiae bacterium]|nr:glycosyl hydrolase family 65 protein [Verrucomicrobiae bacterium]